MSETSSFTITVPTSDHATILSLYKKGYILFDQLSDQSLCRYFSGTHLDHTAYKEYKLTPQRLVKIFQAMHATNLAEGRNRKLSRAQIENVARLLLDMDQSIRSSILQGFVNDYTSLIFLPSAVTLTKMFPRETIGYIVKQQFLQDRERLGIYSTGDIIVKMFKHKLIDEIVHPTTYVMSVRDLNDIISVEESTKVVLLWLKVNSELQHTDLPNGNLRDGFWALKLMST